jgi:hypothetical protein
MNLAAQTDLAPPALPAARVLGAATLGLTLLAVLGSPRMRRRPARIQAAPPDAHATRQLYASAAMLAASVLADSALEHYRGGFANPGMFAPLASSAAVLASAARAAGGRTRPAPALPFGAACAIGLAGLGFHSYNVLRRPGGLSWANLFYAAPLGAPAALSLAGVLGLAARAVARGAPVLAGVPRGRALCALAALGLAGTSAEAALLHFRGAYQHPAMWLPVSVPPVGAALLVLNAVQAPSSLQTRFTRAWLAACTWLGLAGMGFHARGVARQMGGWANWSQNLLSGPPLPAPPSFSALALAGRAALALRAQETA